MHRVPEKSLPYGRFSNGIYFPKRRDAGFFSLCSTSLLDLTQIRTEVQSIRSRGLFREYTNQSRRFMDAWSVFFKQPSSGSSALPDDRSSFRDLHHHSVYQKINIESYQPFISKYFSPSELVLSRKADLMRKYGLDLGSTVAINIRGTDKYTEIESPSISTYIALTVEALSRNSGAKILLVTDQQQYLEVFQQRFGTSLISFDELPTTYGDVVIHKQLRRTEREAFGLNFLSTVLIMSEANEVITHTGNGALWTSLLRGGTFGLTQLRGNQVFRSVQ
jgi:hypothetical protein